MLRDKQKRSTSFYVILTLYRRHPTELTALEEQHYFFDKGRPFSDPTTHHHELFSTTTPDKPSNVFQALKVTDQVNWIKCAYAQYDKNRALGILTDPFTRKKNTKQPASSNMF